MSVCSDCHSACVDFICPQLSCLLCSQCKSSHDTFLGHIEGSPNYQAIQDSLNCDDLLDPLDLSYHKDEFEAKLPAFYRRPYSACPEFYRTQFIKAKYVWRVFSRASNAAAGYTTFQKQGSLLKRLRDTNKFVVRHFRLDVMQNSLKYYIKSDDTTPKACIDLEKLNATFVDSEAYRLPAYSMLINYVKNGSTRNIFVRSEDPKVICDWYNVIRFGKFHRICLSRSGMNEAINTISVASHLVQDVRLFGWLEKTGPSASDAWRKRWVYVLGRKLLYSSDPLSPYPKGEQFIGHYLDGYSIVPDTPPNWKKHSGFAFTLYCPTTSITTSAMSPTVHRKLSHPEQPTQAGDQRAFVFMTQYREVRDRWCECLRGIIETLVTLEDRKEACTRDSARIRSMRL